MSELSEAWISKTCVEQGCLPSFELQTSGPTAGGEINVYCAEAIVDLCV